MAVGRKAWRQSLHSFHLCKTLSRGFIVPKKNRIGAYCKSSGMKINRLDFVSAHHGTPLIVSSLSVERNERTRLNPGSHVSFLFV